MLAERAGRPTLKINPVFVVATDAAPLTISVPVPFALRLDAAPRNFPALQDVHVIDGTLELSRISRRGGLASSVRVVFRVAGVTPKCAGVGSSLVLEIVSLQLVLAAPVVYSVTVRGSKMRGWGAYLANASAIFNAAADVSA